MGDGDRDAAAAAGNTMPGRASVPIQILRSLTVSKTKAAASAEHRSHSPGMP